MINAKIILLLRQKVPSFCLSFTWSWSVHIKRLSLTTYKKKKKKKKIIINLHDQIPRPKQNCGERERESGKGNEGS
jgi:hypothetical protein